MTYDINLTGSYLKENNNWNKKRLLQSLIENVVKGSDKKKIIQSKEN